MAETLDISFITTALKRLAIEVSVINKVFVYVFISERQRERERERERDRDKRTKDNRPKNHFTFMRKFDARLVQRQW